jgi:hypothetical protein
VFRIRITIMQSMIQLKKMFNGSCWGSSEDLKWESNADPGPSKTRPRQLQLVYLRIRNKYRCSSTERDGWSISGEPRVIRTVRYCTN